MKVAATLHVPGEEKKKDVLCCLLEPFIVLSRLFMVNHKNICSRSSISHNNCHHQCPVDTKWGQTIRTRKRTAELEKEIQRKPRFLTRRESSTVCRLVFRCSQTTKKFLLSSDHLVAFSSLLGFLRKGLAMHSPVVLSLSPVSYTHLTLPTRRTV